MARPHHLSMTGAVIVCLVSAQANATLFANDDEHPGRTVSTPTPSPQAERPPFTLDPGFFAANPLPGPVAQSAHTFTFAPAQSSVLAAQVYQGRPYRMRGQRDGSIAALMIGAVATITGAAILVYANRPDCERDRYAGGCGYGTKVIGGSVLSGGIVSLTIGALTW